MANTVLMPQAGISVESCVIGTWKKNVGDKIAVGDILFDYETDKAEFECESTAEGTLLEIFFQDGDEVPVLVPVCAIGNEGEDVSSLRPDGSAEPEAPTVMEAPKTEETAAEPVSATEAPVVTESADQGIHISPRARKLAEEQKVDIRMAQPTGPDGRIIERDIRTAIDKGYFATGAAASGLEEKAAGSIAGTGIGGRISVSDLSAAPAVRISAENLPEYEDVKFSRMRATIAKNMEASLANIPQLTHNFSFDATAIKAYRAQLKASDEELGLNRITLGDMILYAVSRLLPAHPDLNAHMIEKDVIRHFNTVHLGFACDTPKGLLVPVIRNAERKSLLEISQDVKRLATAAREGSLALDEMSGATFTVSNLGSFGVESFTPVINPPQTGILGVDNIINRPVMKDGQVALYPAMGLSLTYDHRAVDGAPASRFVHELCGMLENFSVLLAR